MPFAVSRSPQLARRTGTAAESPLVHVLTVAPVAGMRILLNSLNQFVAAERRRELPRLGLIDPHQRRLDHQRARNAKAQAKDTAELKTGTERIKQGKHAGVEKDADSGKGV